MSLLRAAAEISLSSIASSSLYVGLISLAILGLDDGPKVEVEDRPRAAASHSHLFLTAAPHARRLAAPLALAQFGVVAPATAAPWNTRSHQVPYGNSTPRSPLRHFASAS